MPKSTLFFDAKSGILAHVHLLTNEHNYVLETLEKLNIDSDRFYLCREIGTNMKNFNILFAKFPLFTSKNDKIVIFPSQFHSFN